MRNEHDLLQSVIDARQKCFDLETSLAEAKKAKDGAESELLQFLEHADMKGFKSALLNSEVAIQESLFVKIEDEKKEEAFNFIDEELGRGDAIKTVKQIHHKTLTSLISDRLKKGEYIPEGLFNMFFKKDLKIKPMD